MIWVVTAASIVTAAGLISTGSRTSITLQAPPWAPNARRTIWISALMFGLASFGVITGLRTEVRVNLISGLWLGSLGLLWVWIRMFLTPRLSASFTTHNVAWVGLFLAAGSVWASSQIGGYLMLPLLVWLIYLGAVNFFVWQINQPSQRH